jgi:hypothetical protein
MIVAALAELKFFFVECALIIGLALLMTKFSWRKLLFLLLSFVGLLIGATIVVNVFPHFADFFSVEWFLQTALSNKGYTHSGDLNRLSAIPMINDLWLTTSGERMFGLGLGNCDYANYSFLDTPFHQKYQSMHYTWILYALMYLECGWIGLFFYFMFFAIVYFKVSLIEKHTYGQLSIYCKLARIMSIMCAVVSVYNASLRTEAGYMAYFVLSIPFVYDRVLRQEQYREKSKRLNYECI